MRILIIHSVKKVPGIDYSKSLLKEIVKNLFDAKLGPLFSILTWSSSAICNLVCSQRSILPVYLKCVSRFYQYYIIISIFFLYQYYIIYQKHVHMSGTVHSNAVEMWWKICLALVGHQRLQLKLTSPK